jgi:hypothetical protein
MLHDDLAFHQPKDRWIEGCSDPSSGSDPEVFHELVVPYQRYGGAVDMLIIFAG